MDVNSDIRLAVLIDADNASATIAADLFAEIAKIGEAPVRRIYGDFSGTQLKSWTAILPRFAIEARHSSATSSGKNVTDIALVIDAMDLLHSNSVSGFCLVSSDSDFANLAVRLRQSGIPVYGFGEKAKAPKGFQLACTSFRFTDKYGKASRHPKTPQKVPQAKDAIGHIERALGDVKAGANGQVALSQLGKALKARNKNFLPRNYGERNLTALVKATDRFEVFSHSGTACLRKKPAD